MLHFGSVPSIPVAVLVLNYQLKTLDKFPDKNNKQYIVTLISPLRQACDKNIDVLNLQDFSLQSNFPNCTIKGAV